MLAISRKQQGFQRSATFLTAPLPADTVTNREKGRLKFLYPLSTRVSGMLRPLRQSLPTDELDRSRVTIMPGHIRHLPAVYMAIRLEASMGHFSNSLLDEKIQFTLLAVMLGVTLFRSIRIPGIPLSRALLRVAKSNGVVVGHSFLINHHGMLEIATCEVANEDRRSGIGKMLVDDAIKCANNLPVVASCMPKSHAMCMLLRNRGFVETGCLLPIHSGKTGLRHWQYFQPSVTLAVLK